jgi:hypothetical protein
MSRSQEFAHNEDGHTIRLKLISKFGDQKPQEHSGTVHHRMAGYDGNAKMLVLN